MNYLSIIERYREHRGGIRELLASILSGIAAPELIGDSAGLRRAMQSLATHYPFADFLYTLDQSGIQTSDNVSSEVKLLCAQTISCLGLTLFFG